MHIYYVYILLFSQWNNLRYHPCLGICHIYSSRKHITGISTTILAPDKSLIKAHMFMNSNHEIARSTKLKSVLVCI